MNLETNLQRRLDEVTSERQGVKELLEQCESKIKNYIVKIGQNIKPRETESELIAELKALEHKHSTTSQNNAEERQFMRDMDKVRQKKKTLVIYNNLQSELDALKLRRNELYHEVKEKEKSLDELTSGLKRVRLSGRLDCDTSAIVEQRFSVPKDKLSRIIGKGGARMKQVETDCGVSIDTVRDKSSSSSVSTGGGQDELGIISITGTNESIQTALLAITTIVNTATEEFSPPDEAIVCMTLDKAALTHSLQEQYNVRIDVSRAKKMCKITGLVDDVHAARIAINSIDYARAELPIEEKYLGFIVGKGGATIKALEESGKVQIDKSSDNTTIVVLGYRPDVNKTIEMLNAIIYDNKIVEEIIYAEKHVLLGCFMGPGAKLINSLQKELNVYLHADKGLNDGDPDSLIIRGTTAKVIQAKQHLIHLKDQYISQTFSIQVPEEYMSLIVGKKGSKIKLLRDEYPDANIDIQGSTIHIYSKTRETTELIKTAIEGIILSNYSTTIPIEVDTGIMFKSQKGADLRNSFNELNVNVDIDSNNEFIKMRGTQDNVQKALELLSEFSALYYCEQLSCSDEDCNSLQSGGVECPAKKFEADYGVEIYVGRKDSIIRIRGTQTAVEAAKTAILGFLGGDDASLGSILLSVEQLSLSALIGKSGANIKKMETEYGVKIDLLRSKLQLRLRGDPENIYRAKTGITNYMFDIKITHTLDSLPDNNPDLEKILNEAAALFRVEIATAGDENNLIRTIKGPIRLVEDTNRYLTEKFSGKASYEIPLQPYQFATVVTFTSSSSSSAADAKHAIFKSSNDQVSIDIDNNKQSIVITGSVDAVHVARREVFRALDVTFPSEFLSIAMSLACLQDVGSYKTLAEIAELTAGALLISDRPYSCVRVSGEVNSVASARKLVKDKELVWNQLHAVIDIEESLLPGLVGKKGATISALENENKVKINVNRKTRQLEIEGSSPGLVISALEALTRRVEQMKKEHWEITIGSEMIGSLIGKQGANIKKLRTETGASIEFDATSSNVVKVTGSEENVALAKEKILELVREETRTNHTVVIHIPTAAFPFVIGSKGSIAKEIQEVSGAKFDLDRQKNSATARGSEEACEKCRAMIQEILDREGFFLPKKEVIVAPSISEPEIPIVESDMDTRNILKLPPGASPELIAKIQERSNASVSKSSIRRRRRKETKEQNVNEEANEFVDDYNNNNEYTTSTSILTNINNNFSTFGERESRDTIISNPLPPALPSNIIGISPSSDHDTSALANKFVPSGQHVGSVGVIGRMPSSLTSSSASYSSAENSFSSPFLVKNFVGIPQPITSISSNSSSSNNITSITPISSQNTLPCPPPGLSSILPSHFPSKSVSAIPTTPSLPITQPVAAATAATAAVNNPKDGAKSSSTSSSGYFKSKSGFAVRL